MAPRDANSPALSVVVIVHRSSRQAGLALESLSPGYQCGLEVPYEVLVVEADSDDPLGAARAAAAGPHTRYLSVPAGEAWRARAIQCGIREATAPVLGLIQDASHIVTPGTLGLAWGVLQLRRHALVVVADYCLDPAKVPGAGDVGAELGWLATSAWRENPYGLFDAARYGPAAINGPLSPILGASVMFATKDRVEVLLGLDASLDRPGGAALRLHLFTELCRIPGTELIALVGEGAFRVTHPEVMTDAVRWDESSGERSMVAAVLPQGPAFQAVHRAPQPYGTVGREAQPQVERSDMLAKWHCAVCQSKGEPSWYEDPSPGRDAPEGATVLGSDGGDGLGGLG